MDLAACGLCQLQIPNNNIFSA